MWLIFVLVMLWTGFPEAFAAIASSFYVPLIITPSFLGTVAGAVASGRVPAGVAEAHPVRSFVNPTSMLGGVLAVVACADLAAVYLTADARQANDLALAEAFGARRAGPRGALRRGPRIRSGLTAGPGGYPIGMSFMLDPTKPIPEAVRATAEKQLEKIVGALSGQAGLNPDEATHDARKRTKKLRALLRLVRPELGDDRYRRENRALRDAARQLSAVRDAWVLVEALDDLLTPATDALTEHSVAPLRSGLVEEHRALQTGQGENDTLGRAASEYERVLARVSRWKLPDHGWDSLDDGLETVVRDGRQEMAKACSRGRVEDFHEWRKQVKYLRHQFELVRPAWPDVLEAMADTAAEIGDLLGTDHDLAVLRERVMAEPALASETRQALLDRIDERRGGFQGEAIALARRLYAEKPSALTNRLGGLWKAAA